jgi:hypothetical protein
MADVTFAFDGQLKDDYIGAEKVLFESQWRLKAISIAHACTEQQREVAATDVLPFKQWHCRAAKRKKEA